MSDPDITEPYGISDTPIIMVISKSPVYGETLLTYLVDFQYRVAGPFDNVDSAHAFCRRQLPDLIIFDAMTTQSELISFSQLLQSELKEKPVLLLHHGDDFSINHHTMDFIYPPLNPIDIKAKISKLIDPISELNLHPVDDLVNFINQTAITILDLAPDFAKVDINSILEAALTNLSVRNSEISMKSSETLFLQVRNSDSIDIDTLKHSFMILLDELVDQVNKKLEAEWGKSLVEDALEAVTIELNPLNSEAIEIVEKLGKGYHQVITKFKHAVPEIETLDRNVIVAKLLLTDWGPELRETVSTDESLKEQFDDGIASQLLTLVGQGSQYHQGIFGPVPLPRSEDIVAIIWSKLIKSDIKDERMAGKTLLIVTVGFRQEVVNNIPTGDRLRKIFAELETKEHEKEVDELTLEKVLAQFQGLIL